MVEKTSVLLSDVSIKGNIVEKGKLTTDSKIEGDITADQLQTHESSNITGNNEKHIFFKDRPQEVKFATCSADKARKLLDYGTKVSLEKGILSMVEYINDRGLSKFNRHIPVEIISDLTPKTWISDRMNLK